MSMRTRGLDVTERPAVNGGTWCWEVRGAAACLSAHCGCGASVVLWCPLANSRTYTPPWDHESRNRSGDWTINSPRSRANSPVETVEITALGSLESFSIIASPRSSSGPKVRMCSTIRTAVGTESAPAKQQCTTLPSAAWYHRLSPQSRPRRHSAFLLHRKNVSGRRIFRLHFCCP